MNTSNLHSDIRSNIIIKAIIGRSKMFKEPKL